MSTQITNEEQYLTVTENAADVIMTARSTEPDADDLALWIDINGVSNGAYAYNLYFQSIKDATGNDAVQFVGELPIVLPAPSREKLRGATLDFSNDGQDGTDGGLVILNPNTPSSGLSASPASPLGDQVSEGQGADTEFGITVAKVLDDEINPAIAAHGGYAQLVAVENDIVYLRLGGGCQGCGLARVTLSQGIEVALKEAVPRIKAVIDVTDHANGTNPYYEPAKK
ncbi:MAG: NifU family protein [Actinobacteria bacterium]|nr:NifU family protein [Actinomycetota bacterium]MCL6104181.1 NifU family protein [Actinomycetota bacterium]